MTEYAFLLNKRHDKNKTKKRMNKYFLCTNTIFLNSNRKCKSVGVYSPKITVFNTSDYEMSTYKMSNWLQ